MKIKTKVIIPYSISTLIIVVCFLGYMSFVHNLGYPDGFITDYESIMKTVFLIIGTALISISFYSFYLGANAGVNNVSKKVKVLSLIHI